jgi:hypothetical protein
LVFKGCLRVVVACKRYHAAVNVVGVADAVVVFIGFASPSTFTQGVVVKTRSVVAPRTSIVVASIHVRASCVSVSAAVATSIFEQARAVVTACSSVVVARHFIGASVIGISTAVAANVFVQTRTVVAPRPWIVIAG